MRSSSLKGILAVSLGVSTMTVACRSGSSSEASRAKDIVFTDNEWKEFRLTQSAELIKLNDQPAHAIAFYQDLAYRDGKKLRISDLSDVQQSVVDSRTQRLGQMGVPQSDSRWADIKVLQGLVNLRVDLSDSAKTIYCGKNDTPSGFFDRYGVTCGTVWYAFRNVKIEQPGADSFHGIYGREVYASPYGDATRMACLVEFRPPTAKLACGTKVVFNLVATYYCPAVTTTGCTRESASDTSAFPARLQITSGFIETVGRGDSNSGFPIRLLSSDRLGFTAGGQPETVRVIGEGEDADAATKDAYRRAREKCPAGQKDVLPYRTYDTPKIIEQWYSKPGTYRYEGSFNCFVSIVQWHPLFD